jgi:hypothetical protein
VIALYGIPVSEEGALILVDLLLRVGPADDLSAAEAIERGLPLEAKRLAHTQAMRPAILGVLDDPPDGLTERRDKLARDDKMSWRCRGNVCVVSVGSIASHPPRAHPSIQGCSNSEIPLTIESLRQALTRR